MCNNFETKMLVYEIKGLLTGLESYISDAKFNLAFDNIYKLNDNISFMRQTLDRMEKKLNENCKTEKKWKYDFGIWSNWERVLTRALSFSRE